MDRHFQWHSWINIKTIKIVTLKKVCFSSCVAASASLLLNYFAVVSKNES